MALHELYSDADILHGGLWWDPDIMWYVEARGLCDTVGIEDACMVARGTGLIGAKEQLCEALVAVGMDREESEIFASLDKWTSAKGFGRLRGKDRTNVLALGLAIHGYSGFVSGEVDLVIDSRSDTRDALEFAESMMVDRVLVVPYLEEEVWRLLKKYGVRRVGR